MTLIEQFPWGFYFDAETGDVVEAGAVWSTADGACYCWASGVRHLVLRADPWELVTTGHIEPIRVD
jgi:hypothetical protein